MQRATCTEQNNAIDYFAKAASLRTTFIHNVQTEAVKDDSNSLLGLLYCASTNETTY